MSISFSNTNFIHVVRSCVNRSWVYQIFEDVLYFCQVKQLRLLPHGLCNSLFFDVMFMRSLPLPPPFGDFRSWTRQINWRQRSFRRIRHPRRQIVVLTATKANKTERFIRSSALLDSKSTHSLHARSHCSVPVCSARTTAVRYALLVIQPRYTTPRVTFRVERSENRKYRVCVRRLLLIIPCLMTAR